MCGCSYSKINTDDEQSGMHDFIDNRQEFIDEAFTLTISENIIIKDLEKSKTEIKFTMQNISNIIYGYGHFWILAKYTEGQWKSVPNVSNIPMLVPSLMETIHANDYQDKIINWNYYHDELLPGKYIIILNQFWRLNDRLDINREFPQEVLIIEFEIELNTPVTLN